MRLAPPGPIRLWRPWPPGIVLGGVAVAAPLVALALLRLQPQWDPVWRATSFHFWIVSGASLLAGRQLLLRP